MILLLSTTTSSNLKTLHKTPKLPYRKIRWNYGFLCSETWLKVKALQIFTSLKILRTLTIFLLTICFWRCLQWTLLWNILPKFQVNGASFILNRLSKAASICEELSDYLRFDTAEFDLVLIFLRKEKLVGNVQISQIVTYW